MLLTVFRKFWNWSQQGFVNLLGRPYQTSASYITALILRWRPRCCWATWERVKIHPLPLGERGYGYSPFCHHFDLWKITTPRPRSLSFSFFFIRIAQCSYRVQIVQRYYCTEDSPSGRWVTYSCQTSRSYRLYFVVTWGGRNIIMLTWLSWVLPMIECKLQRALQYN